MHTKTKFLFGFIISLIAQCNCEGLKVYYNVTDEEYHSIPPIFHLDNYDSCMSITSQSTLYCYATVELIPVHQNGVSPTWIIIEEINSSVRTYRHDLLRHGLCLPKSCPEIPHELYAVGNGTDNLWKGISLHYTKKYESLQIQGIVTKLHCQTNSPYYDVDNVDILYAEVIASLVLLLIIATIYDGSARFRSADEYYKLTQTHTFGKLMSAFSLIKNWERLRSESTSEDAKALAPIQGVRVYNTYFVILSHTIMVMMLGPVQNTKYVEDATLRLENMFISNGPFICQTFFMFSGWFLSYNFCLMFQNKKVEMKHLFMAFINRYFRLAPILLLSVGFSSTWLRHLGDGPIWEHIVGDEFRNCRNNWWTNMLFINNIYKPEEICLQQTWYIACDTQNCILGLFIIMAVINYKKHALKIFTIFIILGISLSIGHIYYKDYDIVYRSYPEVVYNIYLKDPQWLDTFIAGHFSIASYVQGMACGYYFYKYRKENRKFLQSKVSIMIWLIFVWVVPIVTILVAGKFYEHGFSCNRWHAALYQGLCRYLFIFPISIAILAFTLGLGWYMISVCSWGPLQIMARVSFSMYLTHVWYIRARIGTMRTLTYISNYNIIVASLGDFMFSLIGGTIVCLAVEMPLSAIQKIFMNSNNSVKVKRK